MFYLDLFRKLEDAGVRYLVVGVVNPPVEFEAAYSRRVVAEVSGQKIAIASIADIIAMKTGTGRAKDQSDISSLTRLKDLDDQGRGS